MEDGQRREIIVLLARYGERHPDQGIFGTTYANLAQQATQGVGKGAQFLAFIERTADKIGRDPVEMTRLAYGQL